MRLFCYISSLFCMLVTATVPLYEGRSFNCITNGQPYRVAVRSTWKLRSFHWGVIIYNRMEFRSNPFSHSKVIENYWFSHIHSTLTVCKMKIKQALRHLCLIHDNAPAHKCVLVQDFLKEEKGSSALSSTLIARD